MCSVIAYDFTLLNSSSKILYWKCQPGVVAGLKEAYRQKLLPLERCFFASLQCQWTRNENAKTMFAMFFKNVKTCQKQLIVMLQNDKKDILPKFCQTPNGVSFQYFTQIHLLFRHYSFHDFHSPPLDDTDFDSLPLVLVIGGWPLAQKSNLLYFNRGL